jgi:hypothetical protein
VADLNLPVLQFHIIGKKIRVRCDDELLMSLVLSNYEAFVEPGDTADLEYTVRRRPSGGFHISRGNETLVDEASDEIIKYLVVYSLEKLITLDLQHLRTDLYFVHSSVLERGERAIMIVAESGTGKSTTTWALLQHGFRYLSDELAPIDPASLVVHPYPHALCLKSPPPGNYPLPEKAARTERTIHIPVTTMPSAAISEPRPLHALFFLQRNANACVPSFTEVSPAEAGARLYVNTLNALAHPGSGLDVAIRIAGAVPAYSLNAGELRATCELISNVVERI